MRRSELLRARAGWRAGVLGGSAWRHRPCIQDCPSSGTWGWFASVIGAAPTPLQLGPPRPAAQSVRLSLPLGPRQGLVFRPTGGVSEQGLCKALRGAVPCGDSVAVINRNLCLSTGAWPPTPAFLCTVGCRGRLKNVPPRLSCTSGFARLGLRLACPAPRAPAPPALAH